MQKILILTYYFPPNAGAHVQRIAKFTKYLPDFGYKPIILTNKNKTRRQDKNLAKEVQNCKIYYCKNLGRIIPGELRKYFAKLSQPDKLINWRFTVIKKALKIVKKENIDLIFVSNPPHSIGYIGSIIAKKANLPFVLDFRDEWITFPLFEEKSNQNYQRKMYSQMLNQAQGLVTVNKTFEKRILQSTSNKKLKSEVIFNGFDKTDIPKNISPKNNKKIKIIYNGRFKKISDPTDFFKILSKLFKEDKLNPKNFELVITGEKKNNQKWLKNFPELLNISVFTGYLNLKETYRKIAEADIGLIFLTNYGKSSAFPLKMFDYFALQLPIIAYLDREDELSISLKQYGAAKILLKDSKINIENELIKFIEKIRLQQIKINPNYVNSFNRYKQTEKLSEFFNKILNT